MTRRTDNYTVVNFAVEVDDPWNGPQLLVGGWGPCDDSSGQDEATAWMEKFIAEHDWDRDDIRVVQLVTPDDPAIADLVEQVKSDA